ncbi:MAG: hypothetical protein HY716_07985 [Planctomycetes bacterium]|nr:hypothetical protein [Planctomycetota bacterium]
MAKAGALQDLFEESMTGIRAKQLDAFAAFRREAMQGNGFSPEVERAAGRANHEEHAARKEYLDRLHPLEKEAEAILTDPQRKLLSAPAGAIQALARVMTPHRPRRFRLQGELSNVVRKLHRMSDAEFGLKRDDLVRELKRAMNWDTSVEADPAACLLRIHEAMAEIRKLPKDKLHEAAPEILDRVKPLTERQRIGRELREIYKQKHGAASPLGHFLASPETRELMAKMYGLKLEGKPTPTGAAYREVYQEKEHAEARLERLRREINLLNLCNGMYFSKHQMLHIAAAAREAGERRKCPEPDLAKTSDYANTLRIVWWCIDRGVPIPESVTHRMIKLARESRRLKLKKAGEVKDLGECVERILFESQKAVLFDYSACLIPPRDLRDPVRVGQANDRSGQVRFLERVRRIPYGVWEERRERIVEEALSRAEEAGGKFPEKERAECKERLMKLLTRVRKMEAAAFELEKEDLAKEMDGFNRMEKLRERLKEMQGEEAIVQGKIRAFLLDPCLGELLAERLDRLKRKEEMKSVNLDDVSPAPSCKNGGCAVHD